MISEIHLAMCLVVLSSTNEPSWTFKTLDVPSAHRSTGCTAIDGDNIVGNYLDSSGGNHGFLYDGSSYTTLDHPSAVDGTNAAGISKNNIVGV